MICPRLIIQANKLLICAKSALVGGQMEGSIWLTEHARARSSAEGCGEHRQIAGAFAQTKKGPDANNGAE
jgi:hypothetical protein